MISPLRIDPSKLPPGFDDFEDGEANLAAAWARFKRDNNPPQMLIHEDLFDGGYRWRLTFSNKVEGRTLPSLAEARAAAWLWYDARLTLLKDVERLTLEARALGHELIVNGCDGARLGWPQVLELTNREGAAARASLSTPKQVVYKVLHKTCRAAHDRPARLTASQPPLTSAEEAWKHHAGGFETVTNGPVQRSHYLVIPCEVTGEKDDRGAELLAPRWEDAR